MLHIYELHTNEGKTYVRSNNERLRDAMRKYIKNKLDCGYRLNEIEYSWSPVYITGTV